MITGRKRSPLHSCLFSYGGLSIRVASSDPSELSWLAEFLGPSFHVRNTGPSDCRIEVVVDPRQYAELNPRRNRTPTKRRDGFFLDTRILRVLALGSVGDRPLLFDTSFDVFYLVDQTEAGVTILTDGQAGLARLALMRVVREYVMNHVLRSGGILLHGAAFLLDRRVVVIAGRKGSGKTSLLLHTLQQKGSKYVSNDRVLIDRKGGDLLARGLATIVTLRRSMLKMFPAFAQRLRSASYAPELSLREAKGRPLGLIRPRQRKFTLSPAQLCDALGVGGGAGGRLGAILLPRVTDKGGKIGLRILGKREAEARLRDGVFRSDSPRKVGSLWSVSGKARSAPRDTPQSLLPYLASTVPCYDCRLGWEAYKDLDWSEKVANLFGPSHCPPRRPGGVR